MRAFKLLFVFAACLCVKLVFAQPKTAQFIEDDLLKSFIKIKYWAEKSSKGFDEKNGIELFKANDVFGKNLSEYTRKYPATISQSFSSLTKNYLTISTSEDGLFRLYSWDTETGGTMHFFRNVFQFKVGEQTKSVLDTPRTETDNRPFYNKLVTLKANGKVSYLAVSLGIESSRYYSQSIQIFEIVNGKLNDDVKIIKTRTGLHSQLFYEYDLGSVEYWNGNKKMIDWPNKPTIVYDSASKTISVPLVVGKGIVTHKVIRYKFTGQYFEKI